MKVNNCIKNLLKFICVLQQNSTELTFSSTNCTKPFLGPSIQGVCYNTRVITLYNKLGELFTTNFYFNNELRNSSYFRVREVDDNCCTLEILESIDNTYTSTDQTIVVNINCICAVKCIEDVYINC